MIAGEKPMTIPSSLCLIFTEYAICSHVQVGMYTFESRSIAYASLPLVSLRFQELSTVLLRLPPFHTD